MAQCIKCKKEVSDEEMRERYDELMRLGIVPTMIALCKECRNAKDN